MRSWSILMTCPSHPAVLNFQGLILAVFCFLVQLFIWDLFWPKLNFVLRLYYFDFHIEAGVKCTTSFPKPCLGVLLCCIVLCDKATRVGKLLNQVQWFAICCKWCIWNSLMYKTWVFRYWWSRLPVWRTCWACRFYPVGGNGGVVKRAPRSLAKSWSSSREKSVYRPWGCPPLPYAWSNQWQPKDGRRDDTTLSQARLFREPIWQIFIYSDTGLELSVIHVTPWVWLSLEDLQLSEHP